jgi:hypothetical protein
MVRKPLLIWVFMHSGETLVYKGVLCMVSKPLFEGVLCMAARPSHTKKAGDGGEKSLVSAHENPRGRMVRKPLLLRGFMHGEKALVDMGFYA